MASGMQQEDQAKTAENFPRFECVTDFSDHIYLNERVDLSQVASKAIMREWRILQKGLPESSFVRVYEERIDLMRGVIIGPPRTPYHKGLFFFDFLMPYDYPHRPPAVAYHSFGLRLNPNLYNNGKVCLSLLNTWGGPPATRWTPTKSTILQVLLSLQALVLNEDPFYNEPMFAKQRGKKFKNSSVSYNDNAFLYSCMTMRYLILRPPKNFEGFIAQHFLENSRFILTAFLAYINGFVEVGKYENEDSYLDRRIGIKASHVRKLRQHLPLLFNAFRRNNPTLDAFMKELNERTRDKCMEYTEKAKAQKAKLGIVGFVVKFLFACGSGNSNLNNKPPLLLEMKK